MAARENRSRRETVGECVEIKTGQLAGSQVSTAVKADVDLEFPAAD